MRVKVNACVKNVLVKGGREAAIAAARERGIELLYLREVPAFGEVSTVGYAKAQAAELDRWLVEGKAPRVAGSLMYWSDIDEGEAVARLNEMYNAGWTYNDRGPDWTEAEPETVAAVLDRRVAWATLEFPEGDRRLDPSIEVVLDFGTEPDGPNETSLLLYGAWSVSYAWAIAFVSKLGLEYVGTSNGVDNFAKEEMS